MTKADLVEQVADAVGPRVTKRNCGLVVDAFLDAVRDALARGDNIEIRGFGTFKARHRKARVARNPRTGEAVAVHRALRRSSSRRVTSAAGWPRALPDQGQSKPNKVAAHPSRWGRWATMRPSRCSAVETAFPLA